MRFVDPSCIVFRYRAEKQTHRQTAVKQTLATALGVGNERAKHAFSH